MSIFQELKEQVADKNEAELRRYYTLLKDIDPNNASQNKSLELMLRRLGRSVAQAELDRKSIIALASSADSFKTKKAAFAHKMELEREYAAACEERQRSYAEQDRKNQSGKIENIGCGCRN